ncbi:MAG: methyltetrahydrofolate cobalamin methyltransferase, partial [Alphaproteobacteria bacterium]|nr:methyltetrahydrofolate cobalamin methyltransferase [Alphaproteobacteria bacterium]
GLPNRHGLNWSFLAMAIGAGLTSAIANPLHNEEMSAVMGANVVMGHDDNCANWIAKFRAAGGDSAGGGAAPRRRSGRRGRRG